MGSFLSPPGWNGIIDGFEPTVDRPCFYEQTADGVCRVVKTQWFHTADPHRGFACPICFVARYGTYLRVETSIECLEVCDANGRRGEHNVLNIWILCPACWDIMRHAFHRHNPVSVL